MNDEEMVSSYENTQDSECGNPLSENLPHDAGESLGESLLQDESHDLPEEAERLSLDPMEDPDLDPEPAPSDEKDGLEQLRSELNQLRSELSARNQFFEKIDSEYEEFRALYPETLISNIPDSVWKDVENGVPIAAAYALAERRRILNEQKAAESNLVNKRRSAGAIEGSEVDFFSPSEVRAMSQAEVRENYQKIMRSMQKWR